MCQVGPEEHKETCLLASRFLGKKNEKLFRNEILRVVSKEPSSSLVGSSVAAKISV